jgi:hypothetical protein
VDLFLQIWDIDMSKITPNTFHHLWSAFTSLEHDGNTLPVLPRTTKLSFTPQQLLCWPNLYSTAHEARFEIAMHDADLLHWLQVKRTSVLHAMEARTPLVRGLCGHEHVHTYCPSTSHKMVFDRNRHIKGRTIFMCKRCAKVWFPHSDNVPP